MESEDEQRSSFPKNKNPPKNLYLGGPQKTDTSGMSEAEAAKTREADRKKRKKWTDAQRIQRLKTNPIGSPPRDRRGIVIPTLRTMEDVEQRRLEEGHMFPTKEILWMRIAEEAIHRNIHVRAVRSDHSILKVIGEGFYVLANFREGFGWTCSTAVVREGDDLASIPDDDMLNYEGNRGIMKTPLSHQWMVPIIRFAVEKNPGIDYEALRNLMRPYAKDYAITNALVQDARDAAKVDIFGQAEDNVMYAERIAEEMRSRGHTVELIFLTRKETLSNINTIVLQEEVDRRKRDKEPAFDGFDERKRFWQEWKTKNAVFLADALGIDGGPLESKFLSGILVAPSTSKVLFPTTQEVVQADGAHTSFGKYTLFSAYTTTANANMANVAFAILFGNEDIKNWSLFLSFVAREHPTINRTQVTILTDQDKGSKQAIADCIPQAFNFLCAFHRRQNIIAKCGGGNGKKPGTALWMYNKLSNCPNIDVLQAESDRFMNELHPTDRHYLTKIDDTRQYAAARCAMAPGICMYGKSASSGVESMNRANKIVRLKTAVDILNASILLLKLEGERFDFWKEKAWNCDLELTPRGMEIMKDVFDSVNLIEFRLTMAESETHFICSVRKNLVTAKEYQVMIPKVPYRDSYFGTCTCGVPSKDGAPCKHMAVIVKSGTIPGLTRIGIMPYYWTTKQWRVQYPLDVVCNTDISMARVKQSNNAKNERLRYCPDWSIGKKPGRPKKNTKHKTLMDHIEASSQKKRKRQDKMFCKICQKWNHKTEQCWKNPMNRSLDSALEEHNNEHYGGNMDEDGKEGSL